MDLLIICGAAGMSLDESQMGSYASILDCFAVGTEQSRQAPGPPNPEHLGPLCIHAYRSPEALLVNIIKCLDTFSHSRSEGCSHYVCKKNL